MQLVSYSTSLCCNIDHNLSGGGTDYTSGPYTVTIPAGQTRVPFDIPITDDMILEGSEDFELIIVPGSLPDDVTRGNPNRATVNIVDNDGQSLYRQ